MSKNKTATAHGEIEYRTVNCDSCGTEIMADDAIPIEVNPDTSIRWDGLRVRTNTTRNLCEFCAESLLDFGGAPAGAIRRGWELAVWRAAQCDDMGFVVFMAAIFGAIGGLCGLLGAAAILSLIDIIVGAFEMIAGAMA